VNDARGRAGNCGRKLIERRVCKLGFCVGEAKMWFCVVHSCCD
jgi:hypothetical protein